MGHPSSRHMFRSFEYEKTIDEIKVAMEKKVAQMTAKVTEREERIVKIRKEYDISDADMINVLAQAQRESLSNSPRASTSYSVSASNGEQRLIGAGIVQNLLTERTLIEDEKASIDQLRRILRNLRPVTHRSNEGLAYTVNTFQLSEDELEFLGF